MPSHYSNTNASSSQEERTDAEQRFPLPLTSIERFHLFDDEPDYPNVVFGKLIFDKSLDISKAKQAWQLALHSHPFANVEPREHKALLFKTWKWHSDDSKQTPIDQWKNAKVEILTRDQAECWSIQRHACPSPTGSYFGVYSSEEHQRSQVIFCVHHAVADGIACLRCINDWIIIYNNLVAGAEPTAGTFKVDTSLMEKRNRIGLLSWNYLKNLPFQAIALFGAAKFVFRKTASAVAAKSTDQSVEPETSSPFPAIVSTWIDEPMTRKLERASGDLEVTSTSYLLGVWFETLGQVRQEHLQRDASDDWLRVILPMSIRSAADRRLPASNRTAIVQIDRQPPDRAFSHYLKMLHREIGIIRSFQLEKMFLIFIRVFGVSNSLLKRMASNKNSRGAAVFTDLHRPFITSHKRKLRFERNHEAASNEFIQPVDFELAGPIRRGTPLNLSLSRFEGKIKLSLHYDTLQLTNDESESILKLFKTTLQKRLEQG